MENEDMGSRMCCKAECHQVEEGGNGLWKCREVGTPSCLGRLGDPGVPYGKEG